MSTQGQMTRLPSHFGLHWFSLKLGQQIKRRLQKLMKIGKRSMHRLASKWKL